MKQNRVMMMLEKQASDVRRPSGDRVSHRGLAAPPVREREIGGQGGEKIPTVIFEEHGDLAHAIAERIASLIRRHRVEGRQTVLGLATGSTPVGVYQELIRMHRERGLTFSNVTTFNLDEYYPMAPDSLHSYRRFMRENLFEHIDIDPANTHIPAGDVDRDDVSDMCRRYEDAIRDVGGIDFQILGIGKTGHIGFNEPGSGDDSRTRLIRLDRVTRLDAAADFFGEENVPREAVTMGVGTILEAREIAVLATGEHKAGIVRRALEGEIDRSVPVTFLQRHSGATMYVDTAAAADLTRFATPWLVTEVEWTADLTLRAVVWLSQLTGKAILKLTQKDYAEHGLSTLVAYYGSPGAVNGKVFKTLGAKIRGRARLPRESRIICFSPHPDDDVISAGGVLGKLRENKNDITVAYMTSGNIAVFDHDVRRYMDFVERLARDGRLDTQSVSTLGRTVRDFLASKQPGDVDVDEVQDVKRLIREAEAVSAIETLGLPPTSARFLDLPFYQTGRVRKSPIGPEDVAIVRSLLEEIRPDLILVAGDLTDPHGTHRMCKEAIDRALDELNDFTGEVWLYRGAWQEWPIADATWLVPLSQEELRRKIMAIFKHQSQKDTAPFPGPYDEREFWQRVEARNLETAATLDRLGLAEYCAMEAYVVEAQGHRGTGAQAGA